MKLLTYRILTIILLIDMIVAIFFLTINNILVGISSIVLAIVILVLQVMIVKCPHCGARPGLWLLAIWTLFFDFELYIADTLLLRKCPKCEKGLT